MLVPSYGVPLALRCAILIVSFEIYLFIDIFRKIIAVALDGNLTFLGV